MLTALLGTEQFKFNYMDEMGKGTAVLVMDSVRKVRKEVG